MQHFCNHPHFLRSRLSFLFPSTFWFLFFSCVNSMHPELPLLYWFTGWQFRLIRGQFPDNDKRWHLLQYQLTSSIITNQNMWLQREKTVENKTQLTRRNCISNSNLYKIKPTISGIRAICEWLFLSKPVQ